MASQSHLPVVSAPHSAVDILNYTLRISQRIDIHFEPMEYASDLFTHRRRALPAAAAFAALTTMLIARLKVLGNLDIAERRLPQDGQFTVEVANEPGLLPYLYAPRSGGEKMLRLLHQVQQALEPAVGNECRTAGLL